MAGHRLDDAVARMEAYADRTGLTSSRPPRRYLWTDAFAVCNYIGLARATGNAEYIDLARCLVDQVHRVLGRYREDDTREGWLSGLDEQEGGRHPTAGGLRIGKPLPERRPEEPFDERLEWDRDGQYFHYLTKWMFALDQLARLTGEQHYNRWARELAGKAFEAFVYRVPGMPPGYLRMYWKMSVDLSRPLVPSMGQHDPLEGYVVSLQLRATAQALASTDDLSGLGELAGHYQGMLSHSELATADPLGLGGLMADACRLHQVERDGVAVMTGLRGRLLDAAAAGLFHYERGGELIAPAIRRLPFREFGLAIGLHAVERLCRSGQAELHAHCRELEPFLPIRERIESFWLVPGQQQVDTWREHRDINEVMLATSLAPEGFLELVPVGA